MSAVRTILPQIINARTGHSGQVYIQIGARQDNPALGLVGFDMVLSSLEVDFTNEIKLIENPGSQPMRKTVVMARPKLVTFEVVPALFKSNVFENVLGNPTQEQCESLIIAQIDRVTEMWENNSWTGSELQQPRYWNLKKVGMEFLTNNQLSDILAPYEVVND